MSEHRLVADVSKWHYGDVGPITERKYYLQERLSPESPWRTCELVLYQELSPEEKKEICETFERLGAARKQDGQPRPETQTSGK